MTVNLAETIAIEEEGRAARADARVTRDLEVAPNCRAGEPPLP
jgi:hypothetical protein